MGSHKAKSLLNKNNGDWQFSEKKKKPVPVHRVLTPILLEHVPTDTTRNPEKINQSETVNGFHSTITTGPDLYSR